jgi:Arc/MetJ family transcription regulator
MMRTNIVIDEGLMRKAKKLCALKTKREVVESALRLLVQVKEQEEIRRVRGKLKWSGDLLAMRTDR